MRSLRPYELSYDEVIEEVEAGNLITPNALREEDFAEKIDAKLDAEAILKNLPKRLIAIAQKRVEGNKLTPAEQVYLLRARKQYKMSYNQAKGGDNDGTRTKTSRRSPVCFRKD
jgi:hypothetical protein